MTSITRPPITEGRSVELKLESTRVQVLAGSQRLIFEGDSVSGHVLLLDCTLSLVLLSVFILQSI